MKRSEELRQQLENLKALKEQKYYEMVTSRVDAAMEGWDAAWNEYYGKCGRQLSEETYNVQLNGIVKRCKFPIAGSYTGEFLFSIELEGS